MSYPRRQRSFWARIKLSVKEFFRPSQTWSFSRWAYLKSLRGRSTIGSRLICYTSLIVFPICIGETWALTHRTFQFSKNKTRHHLAARNNLLSVDQHSVKSTEYWWLTANCSHLPMGKLRLTMFRYLFRKNFRIHSRKRVSIYHLTAPLVKSFSEKLYFPKGRAN